MLLEEVVLKFLEANGYTTVANAGTDPTLRNGPAGLQVLGRGTKHQVDAIADYRFSPPFSHPYRLLVEAKSIDGSVGLGVVRNALGVVRDVSEFWVDREQPRFHYQYAVFCDTKFSTPSQDFAFVQDIFLLPLADTATLRPVTAAVRAVQLPARLQISSTRLNDLRQMLRQALRTGLVAAEIEFLRTVVEAARAIDGALIGMALNGMPLFLVPAPGVNVRALAPRTDVRIRLHQGAWYLETLDGGRLFSFDLPERLFAQYAERETLGRRAALNLKEDALAEIQATVFDEGSARVIRFVLDSEWIFRLRAELLER
jgi:hypothetical protein